MKEENKMVFKNSVFINILIYLRSRTDQTEKKCFYLYNIHYTRVVIVIKKKKKKTNH